MLSIVLWFATCFYLSFAICAGIFSARLAKFLWLWFMNPSIGNPMGYLDMLIHVFFYCCDFFIFSFSIYFSMFFDALLSILAHKFPPKWTQNPKNYFVNLNEKSRQNPENPTMNIIVTLVNWRREGWVTVVLGLFLGLISRIGSLQLKVQFFVLVLIQILTSSFSHISLKLFNFGRKRSVWFVLGFVFDKKCVRVTFERDMG